MLSYLKNETERRWLIGLWLVWALLLFGGFIFDGAGEFTHRMPLWTRMGSSAALVAAGWSWFLLGRGQEHGRFALLLAVGMSFGWLGDLVMAGLLPGGRNVLAGIGAFGVGHLFYISAGIYWGNRQGLNAPKPRWAALAAWLLIGALAWYFVVFRGQEPTVLHWAALPYALLLSCTVGVATGLALQTAVFIPFAVGSALFLVSDLILATQLFNDVTFRLIGDVIWLTYGPGQMLIVYAAGAARKQGK